MKKNSPFLYLIACVVLLSCGKGNSGGDSNETPEVVIPIPGAINLIAPENNTVCQGTDNADDTFNVNFQWSTATDATDYELSIFNSNGSVLNTYTLSGTSQTAILQRGIEFTWNVKAINTSGESISSTYKASTPGETVANAIPTIVSIELNTADQTIDLTFKDDDGDALFFDVVTADNSDFSDSTLYVENQEVENSLENASEHKVTVENVVFTATFWLKVTLRDQHENQVVEIISRNF